jgi:squalene-hopene/tetraprenyl-beta-curcumene cyclase
MLTAEQPQRVDHQATVARGIEFLNRSQADDGSWSKRTGTGVTSLCTTALLRNGRTAADPVVAKALKFLESNVQDDGGIYVKGSRLKNYETCLAVVCLKDANRDGRYDKIIQQADKYIRGLQVGKEDGKDKSDFNYGGASYGSDGRADLSNTAFLVEALVAAGAGAEDPAVQDALVFVSRCQNLESEHNTTPFAAVINDGGFYYSPAGEGENPTKSPAGGLRSYGSMTYAGLKSMVHAGLKPDDKRVKAALSWLRMHYDLTSNPGQGDAGLYYYYHLMAKALAAVDEPQFEDAQGRKHDWRRELTAELARRQKENGSWVNTNNRWLENDASLVTGFALLTLSYTK